MALPAGCDARYRRVLTASDSRNRSAVDLEEIFRWRENAEQPNITDSTLPLLSQKGLRRHRTQQIQWQNCMLHSVVMLYAELNPPPPPNCYVWRRLGASAGKSTTLGKLQTVPRFFVTYYQRHYFYAEKSLAGAVLGWDYKMTCKLLCLSCTSNNALQLFSESSSQTSWYSWSSLT